MMKLFFFFEYYSIMSTLHKQVIRQKLNDLTASMKTIACHQNMDESYEEIMDGNDLKQELKDALNELDEKDMIDEDLSMLWLGYFEESMKIGPFQVYLTLPKSFSGKEGMKMTFFMMHHGAGSCGLSFACLAKEIISMTEGTCGVFSFDIRGHGKSDDFLKDGILDLRLEELCKDFVKVVQLVCEHFGWDNDTLEMILVGHSIGGAVVSHVAKNQLLPNILGCVVLDIVEGSAINSFSTMMYHLLRRPKIFNSIQEGIDWHLKNKIIKNEQSARISVPMLFKEYISRDSVEKKWVWKVDLNATDSFWHGWLNGLSNCFLSISCAKLLILSNADRLDKTLMIGQMQGKFQLVTFQNTGHFIHEDLPELTAKTIVSFWKRNQILTQIIKK